MAENKPKKSKNTKTEVKKSLVIDKEVKPRKVKTGDKKPVKSKGGRPSKYFSHVQSRLSTIEGWTRNGLILEQVAHNLGVGLSNFMEYQKKYPELREALKRGREVADLEVENALYKRAIGYTTVEIIEEYGQVTKRTVKEIPPDTTAQIFFLKNRRPELWRDRRNIDLEGRVDVKNPMAGLSTEELRKLIRVNDKDE
jgi:hypothetical protein